MATKIISQDIDDQRLVDSLGAIAGLSVLSSREDRAFFSQDVFRHGAYARAPAMR